MLATMLSVGLLAVPCLGWNTWNTFKSNINETLIKSSAKSLVDTGLAQAGYNYVNLDDGWQAFTRDSLGRQQPNSTKFPSGIRTLADFVHSLGLKIGIYSRSSDSGIYDCAFYPGSYGYEERDASTYASWMIDYLKLDNCGSFHAGTLSPQERFLRMGDALNRSGRAIFYSLCQWGNQFPWHWASFSDSYRISGDIKSSFGEDSSGVCRSAYCLNTGYAGVSVLTMIRKMRELSRFQRPGSWGDMDMLEIGTGSMNVHQEQTHFSFWAALKSPLIIGANINTINKLSLDILLNKEIIAISQDEAGVAVNYLPELSTENKIQVWGGPLASGKSRYVVLALNYGLNTTDITIPLIRYNSHYVEGSGSQALSMACQHRINQKLQ
ncbi:glycoside hydrolase family 27 [Trichoderma arundinaceum]|uniref:Alpha-galactosidase n=1 Tax=Trichoderma arundinaceum TaxID=490622 RepID=A0A395NYN5_TRIAR|nr:glycoside hydrolase family 27 [Trichoderma arundinaceum]